MIFFHNLSKPVKCTEFPLSHSFDFCSLLHCTRELDIRASRLRVLDYIFKQCSVKACECHDKAVNDYLGTLIRLLGRLQWFV